MEARDGHVSTRWTPMGFKRLCRKCVPAAGNMSSHQSERTRDISILQEVILKESAAQGPAHLRDYALSILIDLLSYYIHNLHSFWHLKQWTYP